jgi:hypothetical protein
MIQLPWCEPEWAPFGDGAYEASSAGEIRRAKDNRRGFGAGHVMQAWVHRDRTPYVTLTAADGSRFNRGVHQCVAEAFLGPCPSGHEINHMDGVPKNNHAANLEYVTRAENCRHASRLGLLRGCPRPGESNPNAKLTAREVLSIRRDRARGVFMRVLADQYGVSTSLIDAIHRRVRWKHLP